MPCKELRRISNSTIAGRRTLPASQPPPWDTHQTPYAFYNLEARRRDQKLRYGLSNTKHSGICTSLIWKLNPQKDFNLLYFCSNYITLLICTECVVNWKTSPPPYLLNINCCLSLFGLPKWTTKDWMAHISIYFSYLWSLGRPGSRHQQIRSLARSGSWFIDECLLAVSSHDGRQWESSLWSRSSGH